MKRPAFYLLLTMLWSHMTLGQTTATDFTAPDCGGGSHTLFTELNAGKVVVLVWIMPCDGCISDGKAAYDAVHSFASSNPGKVLYWLSDDQGNSDCTALSNWATANSITPINITMFENASNIINEDNFGGQGMPHVVVMGSTSHYIYYNRKSGTNDGAEITDAINFAIAGTPPPLAVTPVLNSQNGINLFPNPARNKISVCLPSQKTDAVQLEVFDLFGKKITSKMFTDQWPGLNTLEFDFDHKLPDGAYFLKANTGIGVYTSRFTIKN